MKGSRLSREGRARGKLQTHQASSFSRTDRFARCTCADHERHSWFYKSQRNSLQDKSIDTGRQVVSPNPLAYHQTKIRYRKHSKMPCSGYLKLIQLLRKCQHAPILNDQSLSATGAVDSRGSSNSKPKFSPFWVAGIPAAIHSGSGASCR